MAGINIYCSSFSGEDKSGSAFEGVLMELADMASVSETEIIVRLKANFDRASDYLLIEPDDAKALLSLVRRYHAEIDSKLAITGDPLDQMVRDEDPEASDPTELKYGAGLGWRAYCAHDLLKAFEAADAEGEPVALVW